MGTTDREEKRRCLASQSAQAGPQPHWVPNTYQHQLQHARQADSQPPLGGAGVTGISKGPRLRVGRRLASEQRKGRGVAAVDEERECTRACVTWEGLIFGCVCVVPSRRANEVSECSQ